LPGKSILSAKKQPALGFSRVQAAFEYLFIWFGAYRFGETQCGIYGNFEKFNLKTDFYNDIFKTMCMDRAKY